MTDHEKYMFTLTMSLIVYALVCVAITVITWVKHRQLRKEQADCDDAENFRRYRELVDMTVTGLLAAKIGSILSWYLIQSII